MMPSKKSTIPKNAQIPVAIVLAVAFAAMLYWRLGPQVQAKISKNAPAASAETKVEVSLDDLKKTLEDIRQNDVKGLVRPTELPPLARNPFILPVADATSAESQELKAEGSPGEAEAKEGGSGSPCENSRPTRDQILASLSLSATCIAEGAAIAVINGHYVHVGDQIEGFEVKDVREGQVLLADTSGMEAIKLRKPNDLLMQQIKPEPMLAEKEPVK